MITCLVSFSLNKAVPFLLVASSLASAASGGQVKPGRLIKDAARVLDEIAKSRNAVPDAVLNSTKCIVLIPSSSGKAANISAAGVASCRETPVNWGSPAFIIFRGLGIQAHRNALLIFILSDRGMQQLRSGELQIRAPRRAAPLVNTTPVTTQVDLTAGVLTYEGATGVLSGSKVTGVIRPDSVLTPRFSNSVSKKTIETYQSSVISFFNTITATGIVIHHTAVIPGEDVVPRTEGHVDRYHQAKGFEILCSGRIYHVAYHYLIMEDGSIQVGRPERCEGAHAQGYNSYLGISVVGDFSSEDNPTGKKGPARPTAKQIASLVQLCRRLKDRYNIPLQHIVRHSDISSTRCPGDRFPFQSFLQQLQQRPRDLE